MTSSENAGLGGGLTLPSPFTAVLRDTVGSTSDEAKRLASAGAAHGTLVWAQEQTAGRGRLDRQWHSPRGNLYTSCILRPAVLPARAAELGFVAALAIAETVRVLLPAAVPVALKWPNDVLADGSKIAGILLEAQSGPNATIDWLVLGMGVNIVSAPTVTPYPATALHALGGTADARMALELLYGALSARFEDWQQGGFGAIRTRWLALARGLGEALEVRQGDDLVRGRFIDLDPDGALVLETLAGRHRITTGDVNFAPVIGA
ncbi:biotin--[acetyl-CoA-carboxylase] ligase [Aliidongia dinghuensis]|uniref:biotin--[biotin carboxyl-carrier protein] ligase n=1 Tax=Aliidongia dinghuensis TaxID=1867774 RepID=A0A8J2YZG5_9PROT|nr:biotin--[acetyl-CoA-carboxylase] ligase [Aliidongia dinghuensis]GGF40580.1 biotin--[acetyl-CoA-carboxylase] ligase [Aliidongia dinghuensis]